MSNERTESPYELLIGTDGWSGSGSCAGYYPDDMPEDWQLCYFSNIHRTVLLPESQWQAADETDVEQWQEDTDPDFMFIPEMAEGALSHVLDSGRAAWPVLDSIGSQIACLLAAPSVSQLHQLQWLAPLLSLHSVCVQLPESLHPDSREYGGTVESICQAGASVAWDTRRAAEPETGGAFLVAVSDELDAAGQRQIIEKLSQWMAGDRRAALLFTGKRAPYAAEQARTLAELMMV